MKWLYYRPSLDPKYTETDILSILETATGSGKFRRFLLKTRMRLILSNDLPYKAAKVHKTLPLIYNFPDNELKMNTHFTSNRIARAFGHPNKP